MERELKASLSCSHISAPLPGPHGIGFFESDGEGLGGGGGLLLQSEVNHTVSKRSEFHTYISLATEDFGIQNLGYQETLLMITIGGN